MADKKITELNEVSALDGSELLAIVQGGETKKGSINLMLLSLLTKQTFSTGVTLDFGYIGGNQCNQTNPSATTTYSNILNLTLNGQATVRSNTSTEPTIDSKLNFTFSGTSGIFSVSIDGTGYSGTFDTDIDTTLDNFITQHASDILSATGITVINAGSNVLQFSGQSKDIISFINVSGTISATRSGAMAYKVKGADFIADTDMDLCVLYNGYYIQYFFAEL